MNTKNAKSMYSGQELYDALIDYISHNGEIKSAVLFGSSARRPVASLARSSSDYDFHLIVSSPSHLVAANWQDVFVHHKCYYDVVRAATGGVNKLTLIFAEGEAEFVLVPALAITIARFATLFRLQTRFSRLNNALNELSTCLKSGFRFVKGANNWASFYSRLASDFPGVRLSDTECANLAKISVREIYWILQKIDGGELCSAQHALHKTVADSNFRLLRELRMRNGQPVPSFGLGRCAETLYNQNEMQWIQVNARLDRAALRKAAWSAFDGLTSIMTALVPGWAVPSAMVQLLHGSSDGRERRISTSDFK